MHCRCGQKRRHTFGHAKNLTNIDMDKYTNHAIWGKLLNPHIHGKRNV
jgi:hypothetical protein